MHVVSYETQRFGSDAAEQCEGTKARSDFAVVLEPMVRPHFYALREWLVTYFRSTPSMRDCQPSPVDLKYFKTSGL
jgi:hypothetical protein